MKRLGLVVLAWGLTVVAADAASPDPKDLVIPPQELSKARSLVRKLGSELFREREEAQDELVKMGRLARPALLEALDSDPNPVVRFRVSRLLPRAEAAGLQARIDTFLADADGQFEHNLPSWKLFLKEVGAEKKHRELYVEMLKSPENIEVLQAIGVSSEAGGRAVSDRRMGLWLQMNPNAFGRVMPGTPVQPRQPALADLATVLFGEIVVPHKDIPRGGPFFMYVNGATLLQQTAAGMNAINNPNGTPLSGPFRKVMERWLDTRTAPEDLSYALNVAVNFRQVKETLPLLRRVVSTEGVQGYARAQAMIYLMQRDKAEVATVKSMLKNDTALGQRMQVAPNVVIDPQLRDIALGLVLHYEGQDLKKYNFYFQPGLNPAQVAQSYWGYGFTSDEDRVAAFKKYEEYEAEKAKKGEKKDDKKDEPKK
jgi:hypothetical protein